MNKDSIFCGEDLIDKSKPKRIAILMFGQARFIDITYKHILEEFDIPGANVDYFGHFWESIGYTPKDEEKPDLEKICNVKKLIPFKNLKIENNKKLNEISKCMDTINNLCANNIPWPKNLELFPYYLGQHVSTKECYKSIVGYEREHNFTYDIIIKARTDVIYKNKLCYSSEEKYLKDKIINYTWLPDIQPYVKCNAMRILDSEGENIHNIYKFYNDKYVTYEKETKFAELKYNRRLAISDWTLIANRTAAHLFYNNWFNVMLATWYEDYHNKSKVTDITQDLSTFFIPKIHSKHPKEKWLVRSEQCLQGSIIRYNNIVAEQLKRRDTKLYHPDNIKDNVVNTKNINSKRSLQNQLQERFPIK